VCCVPCFTGGSYSGGSSGSDVDTWVDDGGRSESIAASYLSHPRFDLDPPSQSPTDRDADANSHNAPATSPWDWYLPGPGPGVEMFTGGILPGGAVQVDPMKPILRPPGINCLKL
jgi:hypothetical protein